ncbi:hypothetical protein BN946_scf184788.g21 [Trametes cinnabarina]|uniref:Uncharacterized protein n=1 Tax=Pycnoporus cinnabarinus TaxID=5643 RepID=A0A060S1C9_PYCCI|nr:hypothetical protein BN946_scf184788.g21 [Trametes cinnabarina]
MSSSAARAGPSHRGAMSTPPREPIHAPPRYSDEESGSELDVSESDEEFESATQGYKSPSPPRDLKGKSPASPSRSSSAKHQASAKRAGSWADLDLSIIVALVSPIGNWLTGGDHIKNLFLIILLIFYLHQIVEIPWQLYLSSRPRKHAKRPLASKHNRDEDAAARLAALAENELRRHEFFYLGLAIASPFIGAAFLRYILSALGDNQALSWFSTTLFVLATGIRPWTHLLNRLNERTEELQDALHTPDEESLAHIQEETQLALDAAVKRIDSLEREMQGLREGLKRSEQLREVCDDLSEILGDVERATKRNERKTDTMRSTMNARLAAFEAGLVQLEERRRRDIAAIEATGFRFPEKSVLFKQARTYFWSFVDKVLYFPRAFFLLGLDNVSELRGQTPRPLNSDGAANGNGNDAALHLTGILINRVRSPEKHLAHLAPRLDTIPEAEDSDSEGTFVSERDGNRGHKKSGRSRSRSRSGSSITRPRVSKPASYGQRAFEYAQGAVLWPYRASVRILVAVLPPVAKVMPKV